ncbi:hypothetical protein HDF18_08415 [Mucilaginibacter sp. X5P1]|uniref:hypothetical protein n=1 Tax=Mucilaginibacter sp. X5P1 TaxID=2723088 RepID=UPI001612697A|nr:hypothetical protein [Mucilaginibacter sp. X5P1]MBB6137680.1 hypothetical protein [Mucilaginibacter sp. X5P1]
MNLKEIFNCLKTHLAEQAIDAELLELLFAGIYQFINRKDLTVNEEKYIRELIKMLLLETFAESQQLTDLLILKNFNAPEFLLFCVNKWQNRFIEIEGIHEQLGFVLKEKNRLYELSVKKNIKHLPGSPSVYYELDQFLAEKYTFLKQLLKLHRLTLKDGERFKTNTRFLINLPVSQFGLFIRMQIEKGLLVKEHIGEIFSFFATHFYTPNSTYISAESLRKKSTDVEFATARKMKGQLIGMLNWLNTNYNLSNYN